MPELPEVETVVRTLEHQLGNRTIQSVEVLWENMIANKTVKDFCRLLENQTFLSYGRRGKYLIFTLTDYILVAHLRMEGKFYVYKEEATPLKHTHVIFHLDQGQLHYNDVRKFGKFYLYKKGEAIECIEKLGLEPFDEKLTAEYCRDYCKGNRTPIKTMLLDQSMIAGIGNIYADEICFKARIHPLRPSCYISLDKWKEIVSATKEILADAIKAGGTTIRSYTSSLGVTGLFQLSLKVHDRKDQCDKCGSDIVKIKVGGRGTYYCPDCQKERPIVIAITGTIGSGKSAVTEYLSKLNVKTISCDEVNSELLDKEETIKDLSDIFGCDYKIVDRPYISNQIFNNSEIKAKVEQYLHTRIKEEINTFIEENSEEEILAVEVPLLFEVNWDHYFDYNVTVISNKDTIYKRLRKNRKMSDEQITQRYNKQMPVEEKIRRSDAIIQNDTTKSELKKEVKSLIKKLKEKK